ncbi:50S ribosomal protein L32 [Candidatus Dependentiae bacterium]|nr:50S ribosomal protein L32 [Candidatus Dependentiae bacterium]
MPVPKRKTSRSRRDKRHANKGIKQQAFTQCHNCQEFIAPHVICKACGYYKGTKILATKSERALKRSESRQAQQARRQATQQAMQAAAEEHKASASVAEQSKEEEQ